MILVVYLGPGIAHPLAVLFFSKSFFGRGLKLPNWEPQKKTIVGAPLS